MLTELLTPLFPVLQHQATLVLNHLVAAEPQAVARLRPHAGRTLAFESQGPSSRFLLRFLVTPAGLFEALPQDPSAPAADLHLRLADPAWPDAARAVLAGGRPKVDIQGDAEFAAAMAWLLENLRWEFEEDLARVVGDAPAHQIGQVVRTLADGLRQFLNRLANRMSGRP